MGGYSGDKQEEPLAQWLGNLRRKFLQGRLGTADLQQLHDVPHMSQRIAKWDRLASKSSLDLPLADPLSGVATSNRLPHDQVESGTSKMAMVRTGQSKLPCKAGEAASLLEDWRKMSRRLKLWVVGRRQFPQTASRCPREKKLCKFLVTTYNRYQSGGMSV